MIEGPITIFARGRPIVISPEELEAALDEDGPILDPVRMEALLRTSDRTRVIARLLRAVSGAPRSTATMMAVAGLIRLGAHEAAPQMISLADRLGDSPGAITRAAAFLVGDRAAELASLIDGDSLLARHSPQAFVHLRRIPPDAPLLFSAWIGALERWSANAGVTAYRAFLGDVAEAAFRALQYGWEAKALLGQGGRGFLVDAICAELPGTTDFLAARAMAWLAGTLEPSDDSVRAAIERARARFRDPEFQADCRAMLEGSGWPPPPALR